MGFEKVDFIRVMEKLKIYIDRKIRVALIQFQGGKVKSNVVRCGHGND